MRFYHGGLTRPKLQKIRKASSIFTHGYEMTPSRYYDISQGTAWILDNGAFTSDFNPPEWISVLEDIEDYDNKPDFVVLPDKFDDPEKTIERSKRWVSEPRKRNLDYYFVAQKPMKPSKVIEKAEELDADGVFVGGSDDWKKKNTAEIVRLAHKKGLEVHIGMPDDYVWAYRTGADSMDSTSIARNRSWERLKEVDEKLRWYSDGRN